MVCLPAFALQPGADEPRDPLDQSGPVAQAPAGKPAIANPLLPQRTLAAARDLGVLLSGKAPAGAANIVVAPEAVNATTDSKAQSLLQRAVALLGTPYRWGGMNPESGFDCSGLVGYVFRSALGIELPRISRDMANTGQAVRQGEALAPGDLVFFSRAGKRIDHVGIYLGNGHFLHAPRTGKDVEIASLISGYWSQKFQQARRVTGN